jgi:hypothetical protein
MSTRTSTSTSKPPGLDDVHVHLDEVDALLKDRKLQSTPHRAHADGVQAQADELREILQLVTAIDDVNDGDDVNGDGDGDGDAGAGMHTYTDKMSARLPGQNLRDLSDKDATWRKQRS